MVKQIVGLNKGEYLDEELLNKNKTNFYIDVAGYLEKHMEAPSLDQDVLRLKEKVAAGACYIVTQMFFDNQKYFEFIDKCRTAGAPVLHYYSMGKSNNIYKIASELF